MTPDDLRLLGEWMARPHWRAWWGEPETELGYVRDMLNGRDTTQPFLILKDGVEAGYIQVWAVADQMFEPWLTIAPWMGLLPKGAVGVDMALADPDTCGKGFGSRALWAFAAGLRAKGIAEIWIDPDPANHRAVRAFQRAGFSPVPGIEDPSGDCLLMRFGGGTDGVGTV